MAFSLYNNKQFPFQDSNILNNDTKNPNNSKMYRYLGLLFEYNMRWNCHIFN